MYPTSIQQNNFLPIPFWMARLHSLPVFHSLTEHIHTHKLLKAQPISKTKQRIMSRFDQVSNGFN